MRWFNDSEAQAVEDFWRNGDLDATIKVRQSGLFLKPGDVPRKPAQSETKASTGGTRAA